LIGHAGIMDHARGAEKIDYINSGIRNRQRNLPFLWRKKMTVQELMDTLEYFPKDAIVMHRNDPVEACYFTRDYLPGKTDERVNIVVML